MIRGIYPGFLENSSRVVFLLLCVWWWSCGDLPQVLLHYSGEEVYSATLYSRHSTHLLLTTDQPGLPHCSFLSRWQGGRTRPAVEFAIPDCRFSPSTVHGPTRLGLLLCYLIIKRNKAMLTTNALYLLVCSLK